VYTAYEYLENRFDGHTRTLASVMYLVSRGLAVGPVLYAPAVILSLMIGLEIWQSILIMGILSISYTVVGGIAAVIFTDVKQMIVMMVGIVACLWIAATHLPEGVGLLGALDLAGAYGKLEAVVVETRLEDILSEKYNLLSALFGGIFLFLGYFGADQSQVQRFLTGKNLKESRRGLFLLAVAKVPMQFVILLLGALLFVHYTFQKPPVFFQTAELESVIEANIASSDPAAQQVGRELRSRFEDLQTRFDVSWEARRDRAEQYLAEESPDRAEALAVSSAEVTKLSGEGVGLLKEAVGDEKRTDTNHIFPFFLLAELPIGLLGLVIAAVFAAAMSSVDSALSSLATSSVLDIYARARRQPCSERRLLLAGKIATLFWGAFAVFAAFMVKDLGPMIEVVNRIGSMFYGPLFGVFMLGMFFKVARGAAGWIGLLGGFGLVMYVDRVVNAVEPGQARPVEFLWYNLIGFGGVLLFGLAAARLTRRPREA
jgi:Na+/proline symporter